MTARRFWRPTGLALALLASAPACANTPVTADWTRICTKVRVVLVPMANQTYRKERRCMVDQMICKLDGERKSSSLCRGGSNG